MKLTALKINPNNPQKFDDLSKLENSIKEFPKMMELRPMVYDPSTMQVLGGNKRLLCLLNLGFKEIPDTWAVSAEKLTEEEKQRFTIVDNVGFGEWDLELLQDWDSGKLEEWGLDVPYYYDDVNRITSKTINDCDDNYSKEGGDGIADLVGYRLSSIWYDLPMKNEVYQYMLQLPNKQNAHSSSWLSPKYSRTNATATERIVKTYMREGDTFFEMCCGWMTFSSTAKYFGFSGKGGDIWDVSLKFCKKQIKKIPSKANVEVIYADCLNTKEDSNIYDFVHSNPPFFSLEAYGDSDNDLASLGKYEGWLDAMGKMGKEAERILKKGGLANFVINDFREKGYLIPMHIDFINTITKNSDLKLFDLVVSEVNSFAITMRKRDYKLKRTVKCHEYIITFKKD